MSSKLEIMYLRHHDNLSVLHRMGLLIFSLNLVVHVSHSHHSIFFRENIFVDTDFLDLFDYFTLLDYSFLEGWNLH